MAINTRDRRASVLGYVGRLALVPPLPDGTIGNVDRAHMAGLYMGLSYLIVLAPLSQHVFVVPREGRVFTVPVENRVFVIERRL